MEWIHFNFSPVFKFQPARVYGTGAAALYDKNEFAVGEDKLYVAISSDRGLCGGIHSGLGRIFKALHLESPVKKSIIVGDKVRINISQAFR